MHILTDILVNNFYVNVLFLNRTEIDATWSKQLLTDWEIYRNELAEILVIPRTQLLENQNDISFYLGYLCSYIQA